MIFVSAGNEKIPTLPSCLKVLNDNWTNFLELLASDRVFEIIDDPSRIMWIEDLENPSRTRVFLLTTLGFARTKGKMNEGQITFVERCFKYMTLRPDDLLFVLQVGVNIVQNQRLVVKRSFILPFIRELRFHFKTNGRYLNGVGLADYRSVPPAEVFMYTVAIPTYEFSDLELKKLEFISQGSRDDWDAALKFAKENDFYVKDIAGVVKTLKTNDRKIMEKSKFDYSSPNNGWVYFDDQKKVVAFTFFNVVLIFSIFNQFSQIYFQFFMLSIELDFCRISTRRTGSSTMCRSKSKREYKALPSTLH